MVDLQTRVQQVTAELGLQKATSPSGSSFQFFQKIRNDQLRQIRNRLMNEGFSREEVEAAVPFDVRAQQPLSSVRGVRSRQARQKEEEVSRNLRVAQQEAEKRGQIERAKSIQIKRIQRGDVELKQAEVSLRIGGLQQRRPQPLQTIAQEITGEPTTTSLRIKESGFERRIRELRERDEAFFSGQGFKRIQAQASLLTGGGGVPLKERRPLGQVAEIAVTGLTSFPIALGGALPSAGGKLAAITEGLIVNPKAVGKELVRASKEVEKGPFSFLPGGTRINPEGVTTILFAATAGIIPAARAGAKARPTRIKLDVRGGEGTFVGTVRKGSTFQGQQIRGTALFDKQGVGVSQFRVGKRILVIQKGVKTTTIKTFKIQKPTKVKRGFRTITEPGDLKLISTKKIKTPKQDLTTELVSRVRSKEIQGLVQTPEKPFSKISVKQISRDVFEGVRFKPTKTRISGELVRLKVKTTVGATTTASDKFLLTKQQQFFKTPTGRAKLRTTFISEQRVKPVFTFKKTTVQPDVRSISLKQGVITRRVIIESRAVTKGVRVSTTRGTSIFFEEGKPLFLGKGAQVLGVVKKAPTRIKLPTSRFTTRPPIKFSLGSQLGLISLSKVPSIPFLFVPQRKQQVRQFFSPSIVKSAIGTIRRPIPIRKQVPLISPVVEIKPLTKPSLVSLPSQRQRQRQIQEQVLVSAPTPSRRPIISPRSAFGKIFLRPPISLAAFPKREKEGDEGRRRRPVQFGFFLRIFKTPTGRRLLGSRGRVL